MKAGQLALGFLTLCICMWVANAASGTTTTTTEAATTTTAATTTSAAATTTTTTTAASTSKVRRKRFRVTNLRYSVTRRYRIYRNTTVSSSTRSRRLRNRRLVRVLRRRNNRG